VTELVHLDVADGIATVTLDSPAKRNALSSQLVGELAAHLRTAAGDDSVRAVVLTHTGRVFCSGADLADPAPGGPREGMRRMVAVLRTVLTMAKPVVARVDDEARTAFERDEESCGLLVGPVEEPLALVIPARTLAEVMRVIGNDDTMVYISIAPGRSQIMFHLNQVDINSQLIDGTFPPIEQIIPKSHKTTTILHTQEFLRACKRAEIFARDVNGTTRVKITPGESSLVPGTVSISAQSQERGDNEGRIDATVSGPGIEVAFNVRYLIDVLSVIKEEQVVLETNEANSPVVLRPVNRDDFTHVIMPMSVNR